MIELFRQGDCLLVKRSDMKLKKGLKFKPCKILHKGSNHDHYFSKGQVEIAENIVRVKTNTVLSHGRGKSTEHKDMSLTKGVYVFEIQQEQDHVKNLKRKVID